jgi:hypothetical protein
MVMTLDNIGKRYGLLPSEVMNKATTFDLFILDAAIAFEINANKDPNTPPDIPEQDLIKMWEQTRGN